MSGPVARGELGQIWRLESSLGAFAVKEWLEEFPWDELEEGAAFQEAASAHGVACPPVRRRRDGSLLLDLRGTTTAVYGWVDVAERDSGIDAAAVGSLLAALHRVPFDGSVPSDPWYTDPVGRDRWDELIAELRSRGAPFAELLAGYRDELVALEALIEPPATLRTSHRDLWADNLRATPDGELCLIDWDNAGLADPTGEVALVLFEFCRGDPARAPRPVRRLRRTRAVPAASARRPTSRCRSRSSATSASAPAGCGSRPRTTRPATAPPRWPTSSPATP